MYPQFRHWTSLCSTLLLAFVTIALLSIPIAVNAEPSESLPDDAALLKMRVKDLKAYLEKKGSDAACVACTSKQEYVSRIHETIDWPDVTPEPAPTMGDEPTMEDLQKMFAASQDDERMAGLKKQLEEAGIDTSKIFTATDFNRDEILKEAKKKSDKMQDKVDPEGEDDKTKSDL